jgi:hypothetical protein
VAEQTVSPAIRKKARRLLADQRVLLGVAGYVAGDHGDYLVAIKGGELSCDCPARTKRCAHVEAVDWLLGKARTG